MLRVAERVTLFLPVLSAKDGFNALLLYIITSAKSAVALCQNMKNLKLDDSQVCSTNKQINILFESSYPSHLSVSRLAVMFAENKWVQKTLSRLGY